MSLRSDATQPPAKATATRSGVLNTSDPFRTAGPLYSDAIRLRAGATLGGTTPSSQFVPASRSQKSIVPNRAASTRAPNGGLDIDALVALTGLRLRSDCDSELDTESVMQMVADVKKWWEKKKVQVKKQVKKLRNKKPADDEDDEGEDEEGTGGRGQGDGGGWPSSNGNPSGGGRSNNTGVCGTSAALAEAQCMVEQHAVEVHGLDLETANADTRAMHADMAEVIVQMDIASGLWEQDADVGSLAWWDRHAQHIDAMAGANWEQGADIGANQWWENTKRGARNALEKAKDAAGRAKGAAGRASSNAKDVADRVKDSSVGQMASRAKDAAKNFAEAKFERFTNEDRITKMERYDYGLYASQNPLTRVLIDNTPTTLPFGGDSKLKGYDPRTRAVEGNVPFYGLIATKQKDVMKDESGAMAFNELAKETLKVLSIEKNRELFAVIGPDLESDPLSQMDKMVLGLSSPSVLIDRALAQGAAQTHALPDKNNTTVMQYPPKPNGAHPLCMGHSMMVPISDLGPVAVERQSAQYAPDVGEAGEAGGDPLSLVRASVSFDWLKQVEQDLVASPLHKEFDAMVSTAGANYKPFIIPVASKYDTESKAFTKSQVDPSGMRAVSALLVVPMTEALLTKTGAFKMSNGMVDMGWKRLYPFQGAPEKTKARKDFADPYGERRKGMNAELRKVRDARDGRGLIPGHWGMEEDLETAADQMGYDPMRPSELVTWSLEKSEFLNLYSVAVFALGVAPGCDVGGDGNKTACEDTMDAVGTGKALMIGTHPLLMGKRYNGANFDGFEYPGTVYTSMGNGTPLVDALSMALDGHHIDLRFLWSSMKLLQSCWSKATNARVSKPSLARFRYLIGLDQELWQNADRAFNFSGYARSRSGMLSKQKAGSFQRRSQTRAAFDDYKLGKAFEELGLVDAETGEQLKLNEMTPSDLATALDLAEIDLGNESDEDL